MSAISDMESTIVAGLTMITLVGGVVSSLQKFSTRLSVSEEKMSEISKRVSEEKARNDDQNIVLHSMDSRLVRMEEKIDQLLSQRTGVRKRQETNSNE